jgi:hypothetical protein
MEEVERGTAYQGKGRCGAVRWCAFPFEMLCMRFVDGLTEVLGEMGRWLDERGCCVMCAWGVEK